MSKAKTFNRKRLYRLNDINRTVGQEATENFEGSYNFKDHVKMFNLSILLETRTRISCLRALFSAKLLTRVSVSGKGDYSPEKISDLEAVFLRDEKESDAFFSKRRVALSDPFIVGYHPLTGTLEGNGTVKSRWNRVWEIHVKNIRSLEIKKEENGECSLFINL
jgi:hypothetical protein